MMTMFPKHWVTHWGIGWVYHAKSMIEEAIPEFEKALELSNRNHTIVFDLGLTYYEWGERAKAEVLFDELKQRSENEYIPPLYFSFIHYFRGEKDQALEWLERSCNERDSWIFWLVNFPVKNRQIPEEPRFNEILEKYGLR
jgi:tetratricopeptide (TPR) repeat protein